MPLYYQLAMVTLVGNAHGIKIIINIPLKAVNQHFNLYKIIVLPFRMSGNNFVKYSVEYPYFGIDNSHRNYILITETHRNRCTTNSITLCPADVPIYSQPVNPACTIKFPPAINCADGTCFSTIEPLPSSDTEHYGLSPSRVTPDYYTLPKRERMGNTHKRYPTQE